MWIITKIGFFNIIEQDDDREKGLLTVKARSRGDLEKLRDYIPYTNAIEESLLTDYQFRIKALKHQVRGGIACLINEIDYGKTKPAISKNFPERAGIYLDVWDTLNIIQYAKTPKD